MCEVAGCEVVETAPLGSGFLTTEEARAMIDDPHWGWHAAAALGADVARPKQYQRAAPKLWPGAGLKD